MRSVQSGVNARIFGFLSIKMIGVQADSLCGPAGFTPNGVDLSSCCDPIRLVRIGERRWRASDDHEIRKRKAATQIYASNDRHSVNSITF